MGKMGKIELYCAVCGLFQWKEARPWYESPPENEDKKNCMNEECECNKEDGVKIMYSVSSMGFAYYARDNRDLIKEMAWTSPKYAPQYALDHYERQGMKIVE